MTANPEKFFSIYDIPRIIQSTSPLACSPINTQAGFRATGIMPFNPTKFSDADYLPNYGTDKPNPLETIQNPANESVSDLNLPFVEATSTPPDEPISNRNSELFVISEKDSNEAGPSSSSNVSELVQIGPLQQNRKNKRQSKIKRWKLWKGKKRIEKER
ncbi:hypothetical protein JTB14_024377 [Gonioctena quinquepunctata]|nr:hypothetical protein JTB14_024377 [Gonioctena quinquepunctata]